MSGHSHFATIKRQKGLKDAAKGKVFSKMGRAISIAVKTGGGGDPDSNYKLRMAVDTARAANMPKDTIERAISKAQSEAQNLEEVIYEGFGPSGVGIMVLVTTDNRNRTSQEMKNIFERGGGNLAGPGSVAFNFELQGLITVKKSNNTEEQMLLLIDAGAEDIQDTKDVFEVYVLPDKLAQIKDKLVASGFVIDSFSLIQKPKTFVNIAELSVVSKILKLLESFDDHDDVQAVYSNFDAPEEILNQVKE